MQDAVPLLCLIVHVDKDGRGGDGSHGGAFIKGRVGRDQVRTQVWPKHSWGENIYMHVILDLHIMLKPSSQTEFYFPSLNFANTDTNTGFLENHSSIWSLQLYTAIKLY